MKSYLMGAALLVSANAFGSYAAISFSKSTGHVGFGTNYTFYEDAAARANRECGDSDCEVVVWARHACAALAVGDGNHIGWAWNTREDVALKNSLAECGKLTANCKSRLTLCTY